MKNFKKSNLFSTFVAMLMTFSVIGFWGCEKDKKLMPQNKEEFLKIEGNLNGMGVLVDKENAEIYQRALKRIFPNLSVENNQVVLNLKDASIVNISDNIFSYYIKNINYINSIVLQQPLKVTVSKTDGIDIERLKISGIVRLKSCGPESERGVFYDNFSFEGMDSDEVYDTFYDFMNKRTSEYHGCSLGELFDLNSISNYGGYEYGYGYTIRDEYWNSETTVGSVSRSKFEDAWVVTTPNGYIIVEIYF